MSMFVGNSVLAFPHRMESIYLFKKWKYYTKNHFPVKIRHPERIQKNKHIYRVEGCVDIHRISHFIHSVSHEASLSSQVIKFWRKSLGD